MKFPLHIILAVAVFVSAATAPDTAAEGSLVDNLIPAPKEITVKDSSLMRIRNVRTILDTELDIPDEGYILRIRSGKVTITAKDKAGLIHGKTTLAQLAGISPLKFAATDLKCCPKYPFKAALVPELEIRDWPAFPIRGFMHDTGRNFREVETLKQEIDLFAFYKLNIFHWHLTDNPAWRIECHAYPQLNDPQFQREGRDEGRFYTYDQIREVIEYARERGITIIPEIDMPGHSQYFNRTFGFGMATPEGMEVLEKCLKEFMQEIPAEMCPYIHIGSDEVKIDDPEGFMRFCEKVVTGGGRTPLAWYPGLPASEGTITQIWTEKGKMTIGDDFAGRYIDSYMGYLNHGNSITNTANLFLHQLCSTDGYDGKALGGILCLWNDVRSDDKSRIFPHNGMPEGLLSFSQSSWAGGKGYGMDSSRLFPEEGTEAYEALTAFEKKVAVHRDEFLGTWNMRWVVNAHIPWKVTITPPENSNCITVRTRSWGGCIDLNEICRTSGITPGSDRFHATLTTEIHVEKDTVITAWVGFDSPSRSNRRSDGIGEQGRWEGSGQIFSGDMEIFPPRQWNEPGEYRYHRNTWNRQPNEDPYTDEQFFWMREPARIPLKAGWNTIRMECPRVFDAYVWMTAFVPVTQSPDGKVREASGIKFR